MTNITEHITPTRFAASRRFPVRFREPEANICSKTPIVLSRSLSQLRLSHLARTGTPVTSRYVHRSFRMGVGDFGPDFADDGPDDAASHEVGLRAKGLR